MCPDARDPSQPCKFSGVCHPERQRLHVAYQQFGYQCDTFVSLEAKRVFHPEPVEAAAAELPPF